MFSVNNNISYPNANILNLNPNFMTKEQINDLKR